MPFKSVWHTIESAAPIILLREMHVCMWTRYRAAHLHAVGGPAAGLGGGGDVGLQLGGQGRQVQVDMLGGAQHGRRPRQLALGVDEVLRRQQVPTLVALVPSSILLQQSRRSTSAMVQAMQC